MEKYIITGGKPLSGEITIGGAKNAAVAIIPATILARGKCVIENVPEISDVGNLLLILQSLGAEARYLDRNTLEIDTAHVNTTQVPDDLARLLRGSYYFLGALLGRFGEANVSMPGGCDFGVRPIDQHIKGFEALGAAVTTDSGYIRATSRQSVGGWLVGAHIHFDVVSVGATINVMMAAVTAAGVTIMENAAKEPHIVDLANFLNSMGADIRGAGTDVIKIHGVDILHPSTYSIIPDQIEAGTYMVLAAATRSNLLIKNVIPKHLESVTDKLRAAGAEVEEYDDAVRVIGPEEIGRLNIKTMPHPGFPTDMQPQLTAMLTRAAGTSTVSEGVWDSRFKYVGELSRMGANIMVDGKIAVIEGVRRLTGAAVRATDLRAGAAMVIAGLMADGTTEITNIEHIERGYERIVEKLVGVGADIRRVTVPDTASAAQ